jgi:NitT/TauT family transport system substrate-binding protein
VAAGCGSDDSKSGDSAAASSGGAGGQTVEQLTLNYYAGVDVSLVPWVATELGLWKDYGLDVKLVASTNGPAAISALLSGDLDLISNQVPGLLQLREQGQDVQGITGVYSTYPFSLIGSKKLPTNHAGKYPEVLKDLKGKTFGVDAIGGVTYNVMRILLKDAGMNPDSDVKFVAIGQTAQLSAAMEAGQIDAFFALPTDVLRLVDVNKSANLLLDVGKDGPDAFQPWVLAAIQGVTSNLDKRPEAFTRFQKAWAGVNAYMADEANSDKVLPVVSKFLNLDEKNAQLLLDRILPQLTGELDPKAVEKVTAFMLKNGVIKKDIPVEDVVWETQ